MIWPHALASSFRWCKQNVKHNVHAAHGARIRVTEPNVCCRLLAAACECVSKPSCFMFSIIFIFFSTRGIRPLEGGEVFIQWCDEGEGDAIKFTPRLIEIEHIDVQKRTCHYGNERDEAKEKTQYFFFFSLRK